MAGRKSKNSLDNPKIKIWNVAEYIRLSQEDSDMRRRKTRK